MENLNKIRESAIKKKYFPWDCSPFRRLKILGISNYQLWRASNFSRSWVYSMSTCPLFRASLFAGWAPVKCATRLHPWVLACERVHYSPTSHPGNQEVTRQHYFCLTRKHSRCGWSGSWGRLQRGHPGWLEHPWSHKQSCRRVDLLLQLQNTNSPIEVCLFVPLLNIKYEDKLSIY